MKRELPPVDWFFEERQCWDNGYALVCGIDEAGRGPLFGPVYAAAVILPRDVMPAGINDSKKLTEKKREALYDEILAMAVAYGIGSASAAEIDQVNILQATYLAMNRAYHAMGRQADIALIDGNRLPAGLPAPAKAIVKGDGKCACIAAASILAKVSRDRKMREYAQAYPMYNFAGHKGYPTKAHYEAIKCHGILPEHRRSFLKNLSEK